MEKIVFSKVSVYTRSSIVAASSIVGIVFNTISLSFFMKYDNITVAIILIKYPNMTKLLNSFS